MYNIDYNIIFSNTNNTFLANFMKDNPSTGKKENLQSKGFRKKYQIFLDKSFGATVSISLNLILIATLSYIVFYKEKPALKKFNHIEMSDIKIPKLQTDLPTEDQAVSQKASSKKQVSSKETDASPAKVIHSDIPKNIFKRESSTSYPAFDGGFMSLGDSIASGGIGSGSPFGHRRRSKSTARTSKRDKEVQLAVIKALKWLKQNQNKNGSWGNGYDRDMGNAISSLAVLAFLAHGENTDSPEFGNNVITGLKNLLKQGKSYSRKGFLGGFGEALLTYVLAEGASVTFVPELIKQTHNRTIIISRKLARQRSSWQTGTLSAWNYQALKAAVFAVPTNESTSTAGKSARSLLRQHQSRSDRVFSKKSNSSTFALDNVFCRSYCLQLFGYTKHPTVKKYISKAVKFNKGQALNCNWNGSSSWPLYAWYYKTNALFFASGGHGSHWRKWYNNMTQTLLDNQNPDGSFYSPEASDNQENNGEIIKTFGTDKNLMVYSTAMCALMLQVKHRYLPSYCGKPSIQMTSSSFFTDAKTDRKLGINKIRKKFDIQQ
jgi:hypothetical protein